MPTNANKLHSLLSQESKLDSPQALQELTTQICQLGKDLDEDEREDIAPLLMEKLINPLLNLQGAIVERRLKAMNEDFTKMMATLAQEVPALFAVLAFDTKSHEGWPENRVLLKILKKQVLTETEVKCAVRSLIYTHNRWLRQELLHHASVVTEIAKSDPQIVKVKIADIPSHLQGLFVYCKSPKARPEFLTSHLNKEINLREYLDQFPLDDSKLQAAEMDKQFALLRERFFMEEKDDQVAIEEHQTHVLMDAGLENYIIHIWIVFLTAIQKGHYQHSQTIATSAYFARALPFFPQVQMAIVDQLISSRLNNQSLIDRWQVLMGKAPIVLCMGALGKKLVQLVTTEPRQDLLISELIQFMAQDAKPIKYLKEPLMLLLGQQNSEELCLALLKILGESGRIVLKAYAFEHEDRIQAMQVLLVKSLFSAPQNEALSANEKFRKDLLSEGRDFTLAQLRKNQQGRHLFESATGTIDLTTLKKLIFQGEEKGAQDPQEEFAKILKNVDVLSPEELPVHLLRDLKALDKPEEGVDPEIYEAKLVSFLQTNLINAWTSPEVNPHLIQLLMLESKNFPSSLRKALASYPYQSIPLDDRAFLKCFSKEPLTPEEIHHLLIAKRPQLLSFLFGLDEQELVQRLDSLMPMGEIALGDLEEKLLRQVDGYFSFIRQGLPQEDYRTTLDARLLYYLELTAAVNIPSPGREVLNHFSALVALFTEADANHQHSFCQAMANHRRFKEALQKIPFVQEKIYNILIHSIDREEAKGENYNKFFDRWKLRMGNLPLSVFSKFLGKKLIEQVTGSPANKTVIGNLILAISGDRTNAAELLSNVLARCIQLPETAENNEVMSQIITAMGPLGLNQLPMEEVRSKKIALGFYFPGLEPIYYDSLINNEKFMQGISKGKIVNVNNAELEKLLKENQRFRHPHLNSEIYVGGLNDLYSDHLPIFYEDNGLKQVSYNIAGTTAALFTVNAPAGLASVPIAVQDATQQRIDNIVSFVNKVDSERDVDVFCFQEIVSGGDYRHSGSISIENLVEAYFSVDKWEVIESTTPGVATFVKKRNLQAEAKVEAKAEATHVPNNECQWLHACIEAYKNGYKGDNPSKIIVPSIFKDANGHLDITLNVYFGHRGDPEAHTAFIEGLFKHILSKNPENIQISNLRTFGDHNIRFENINNPTTLIPHVERRTADGFSHLDCTDGVTKAILNKPSDPRPFTTEKVTVLNPRTAEPLDPKVIASEIVWGSQFGVPRLSIVQEVKVGNGVYALRELERVLNSINKNKMNPPSRLVLAVQPGGTPFILIASANQLKLPNQANIKKHADLPAIYSNCYKIDPRTDQALFNKLFNGPKPLYEVPKVSKQPGTLFNREVGRAEGGDLGSQNVPHQTSG